MRGQSVLQFGRQRTVLMTKLRGRRAAPLTARHDKGEAHIVVTRIESYAAGIFLTT